jgi:nucleotide-binding universal stress UspA family protein
MHNASRTPYVIVVAVDFTEAGARALRQGFELANSRGDAELHVGHVGDLFGTTVMLELAAGGTPFTAEAAIEHLRAYVQKQLAAFEWERQKIAFSHVITHLRTGDPATELTQLAVDLEADLVITGTHSRRGLQRLVLGSVSEVIVKLAPCPVLVARPKEADRIPHIEPPCPQCVAERRRTQGQELWCADHRTRHGRRHTYHYVDRNTASSENMPLVTPNSGSTLGGS